MLEWLKNIAMFLVISGLLLEMIAETKYYKFARWVAGVVLILQLLKPLVDTKDLWERFLASFQSFDYALGSERVLEEIYTMSGTATQSVLNSYKESITLQVEKILNNHSISLLSAEMEIGGDGALLALTVYGAYMSTEEERGGIWIPTVAPVKPVDLTGEEVKEQEIVSPMELYLREILAEFYRVEENRIEVVIQEATG